MQLRAIGIACNGAQQQHRALELIRIDDFGCYFDAYGGTLSDPEKVSVTPGPLEFYVPLEFGDLLDWVQTGRVPAQLAQRKQDLFAARRARRSR